MRPDVVIITGPCGVGKSTVGFECMQILERAGVAAAFVDGELAYVHPNPEGDKWGYGVAEQGLRALWRVYADAGHHRLLLSRVVEDEEQHGIVARAVPEATIRMFRLVAGTDVVIDRLSQREIGSGLDWHIERSEEIARATLGEPVNAERTVVAIANDVLVRAGWMATSAHRED